MKQLVDSVAEWISSSVASAGMRGAVVGMSGGLDSSVTAGLCARGLGSRVLGVLMPCESDPEDEEDARLVAEALAIKTETVRLDSVFDRLLDLLPHSEDGLARANLKPRLRMATLYFFANSLSYLVVGTSNKSELMTGYFTKHGDGAVDILPLGELYKSDVRKLAWELGLPERIIRKAPSGGLWQGQTDEQELGVTYEELDRALRGIEAGTQDQLPVTLVDRVTRKIVDTEHKRAPAKLFEV